MQYAIMILRSEFTHGREELVRFIEILSAWAAAWSVPWLFAELVIDHFRLLRICSVVRRCCAIFRLPIVFELEFDEGGFLTATGA